MKTAISIPDHVYEAAEQTAKDLGVSRSELYATAVREYVERYQIEGVTEKLNSVYREENVSSLSPQLARLQQQSLDREDWS